MLCRSWKRSPQSTWRPWRYWIGKRSGTTEEIYLVDFFAELGMAWTEALVSMDDLTPLEKEDCGAKLDVWWGELDDYDTGEYFGAAFGAIEEGRSYPPLVKALKGIAPDDEFLEEMYKDPLTLARLNVLESRGTPRGIP
jgi:hypothetical protein